MGRVGLAPVMDLPTAYGVRGLPGEIDVSGQEHPDTGDFLLTPTDLAATLRRRLSDAGLALQLARRQLMTAGVERDQPRLLHVASGEGGLLSLARRKFDVDVLGLEPWKAWYEAAVAADVPTLDLAPELLDGARKFDVILEHHLLMRVPEPRAHLRCLAERLDEHGILVIEVPNLLAAPRPLEDGYLSITRPHLFTARALKNLCRKVGLVTVHCTEGTELRVFCRHARPGETDEARVVDGPRVRDVVDVIQGNDLRIKLKRGLTLRGPVPELLTMARKIIDASRWPPARADIAIEVARALERSKDYRGAAFWLRESLDHRTDPEVACMAVRCETIARALASKLDTTAPVHTPRLFGTTPPDLTAAPRN